MMTEYVFAFVVLLVVIIFVSTVRFKLKKRKPDDFFQITELGHQYVVVGDFSGFYKSNIVIDIEDDQLVVLARRLSKTEDDVDEWISLEKKWNIPNDADITSMNKSIKNGYVKISFIKK